MQTLSQPARVTKQNAAPIEDYFPALFIASGLCGFLTWLSTNAVIYHESLGAVLMGGTAALAAIVAVVVPLCRGCRPAIALATPIVAALGGAILGYFVGP